MNRLDEFAQQVEARLAAAPCRSAAQRSPRIAGDARLRRPYTVRLPMRLAVGAGQKRFHPLRECGKVIHGNLVLLQLGQELARLGCVHARQGHRLFREQSASDPHPAAVRDSQPSRIRRLRPILLGADRERRTRPNGANGPRSRAHLSQDHARSAPPFLNRWMGCKCWLAQQCQPNER